MTRSGSLAAMLAAACLACPPGLVGQEDRERDADAGWWDWAVDQVLAGQEVRTSDGRVFEVGPRGRRGGPPGPGRPGRDELELDDEGIPAFCRSGEGHPVYGRRWCVEKGFGFGGVAWRRGGIEDVVFRRVPERGGVLDRDGLAGILGDAVLGSLLEGSAAGRGGAPVTGRWLELEDRGVRVLQLRAGDAPVAELSDVDRDGRVDVLLRAEEVGAERKGGAGGGRGGGTRPE